MSKGSGYVKRTSLGVPAPMEEDSDSEFDTHLPTPEPIPKTKSKRKGTGKGSKARDKLPGEVKRAQLVEQRGPHKQLSSYFDASLGLCSGSEDEAADAKVDEDYNAPPTDSGIRSRNFDALLREAGSKTTPKRLPQLTSKKPSQLARSKKPWTPNTPWHVSDSEDDNLKHWQGSDAENESATESESEVELPPMTTKRKASPRSFINSAPKRRKVASPVSGSSTEDETDPGQLSPPKMAVESMTESETDDDHHEHVRLKARPSLPLAAGTKRLGPFTLSGDTKVPGPINTYLREYQREGINFLFRQYTNGMGGWLGDDMGLGKTIQVIGFLAAIMRKFNDRRDLDRRKRNVSELQNGSDWRKRGKLPPANEEHPTALIIAPSSVVLNWEREFEKWGYFEVGSYSGPPKERQNVLKDFAYGRLDVLLVSFDIALRDIDKLCDLALSVVIVDEAHKLKNRQSQITQALHRFDCPIRFGLSGTIIQNQYQEMFTTLDWTNPGSLGESKDWKGYIVKPLTAGQSSGATDEEREKAHRVSLILRDEILPPLFLRRTKEIIQSQMPKKSDLVVFCPLTSKQVEVYERIILTDAVQNMILKDQPCRCGSQRRRSACHHPLDKSDIFTYISILIKIANHLGLILPAPSDTPEQIKRNRVLASIAFPESLAPKFDLAMMSEELCGKWAALNNLLRSWKEEGGNKVLIFTKSVKLLDMLEHHLNRQSFSFRTLKGAVKSEDRMPLIDEFQSNPDVFVFLVSTLAGGTGLNLTAANKVVIFDPNWNPAHDLQAMDRAYRIGQARDVDVYRLLGSGSVEELIYARQVYKQQQMQIGYTASLQTRYFKGVQGDTSNQGELFGLPNIFKLHKMDNVVTKDLIENAHLAEFSWTLANYEGGKRAKKSEYQEAESKSKADDNFSGLGALLFDDSIPSANDIQDTDTRILKQTGISYTHNNDQILQPSKAAEQQLQAQQAKRKKQAAQRKSSEQTKAPDADSQAGTAKVWPPVRTGTLIGGQKNQMTSLDSRRKSALVALGMIETHDDLGAYAKSFAQKPEEEREAILARLDAWSPRKRKSPKRSRIP